MTDLDARLESLRLVPDDPRLDGLEQSVMDMLAARRAPDVAITPRGLSVAACLALAVGIAVAAVPGDDAVAARGAPLGTPPALAPSNLLRSG